MSSYIKDLIKQGEHQHLDFKFCITDSKKIARSLVAFANTEGGKLLIGIKDNGAIAGVRSEEEYYMIESAAQLYSRPEIYFESENWTMEGKNILEITVPPSTDRPHLALDKDGNWKPYIRIDDENILANNVWLKACKLKDESANVVLSYTSKERFLLEFLSRHNTISLKNFCLFAQISTEFAEDILANFVALDIVEIAFDEEQTKYSLRKKD